jgi:hypothetical protein
MLGAGGALGALGPSGTTITMGGIFPENNALQGLTNNFTSGTSYLPAVAGSQVYTATALTAGR